MAAPGQAVLKTLTDVTSYTEYVEKLNALFADDLNDEPEEVEKTYPPYGETTFYRMFSCSRKITKNWSIF